MGFPVYAGATVQEALSAWWAAQTALQAQVADGKLWHVEAPETTDLPYLTYFAVSEPEGPRSTAYYMLEPTIQISAHASTDSAAAVLRNAVRDAIQSAVLQVGPNTAWYCLPGGQQLTIGEGRGPNGSDCWMATVDVDIPFQKNIS